MASNKKNSKKEPTKEPKGGQYSEGLTEKVEDQVDIVNMLDALETLPELSYENKKWYDKALALPKFANDPNKEKMQFLYDGMMEWGDIPEAKWWKQYSYLSKQWHEISFLIPAKEKARQEARDKALSESKARAAAAKAANEAEKKEAHEAQIRQDTEIRTAYAEMLREQIKAQKEADKKRAADEAATAYFNEAVALIDAFDPEASVRAATEYPIEIQGDHDTIVPGLYSITGLSARGKTVAYQHRIDFRPAVEKYAAEHSDKFKGKKVGDKYYPKLIVVNEPVSGIIRTPNDKASWIGFRRVLEKYLEENGVVIINSASFLLGFNPLGTSDNTGGGPSKEGLYKQFEAVLSELDCIAANRDAVLVCVWNLSSTPSAQTAIEGKSRGVLSLLEGYTASWSRRQYVVDIDSFVGPSISEKGRKAKTFNPVHLDEEVDNDEGNITANADELEEEW